MRDNGKNNRRSGNGKNHTEASRPLRKVQGFWPRRWLGRWMRQGVLNLLLVCLMVGVGLGKQLLIQPRILQANGIATPPVTNLRLTDIFLPKTLRLAWDGHSGALFDISRSFPGHGSIPVFEGVLTGAGGHLTFDDAFNFTPGTAYVYTVVQKDPPSYPGPYQSTPDWSSPVSITVVPQQVVATDNQTVDARYDPRYSTWVFINHKFGTGIYRGGLYAGFNNDNSQVGRSFVKFTLPTLSANQHLWPVGSVNAYYTRSYAGGTTKIICQRVDGAWDGASLTWASALTLGTYSVSDPVTLTYDPAQPVPGWTHWSMPSDISAALGGSGTVAFSLTSAKESEGGWVYFAKREYQGGQEAPTVLYATDAP